MPALQAETAISVIDLTMAYGEFIIQHDLNFTVNRGDIFIIMGGSGCGKTTLLKHMIGLIQPQKGDVYFGTRSYWQADEQEQAEIKRQFGVMFQGGALWSSLTLGENVGLPLQAAENSRAVQFMEFRTGIGPAGRGR